MLSLLQNRKIYIQKDLIQGYIDKNVKKKEENGRYL